MESRIVTHMSLSDRQKWNNIVLKAEEGTFFHSFEWSNILEKYGEKSGFFSSRHIIVEDEDKGEFVGVLPLFLDKRSQSHKLSSLPYGDYGGPCVISQVKKEEVLKQIFKECEQTAKKEAPEVLLKSLPENYLHWLSSNYKYVKTPYHYTFLLSLNGVTKQELWNKFRRDTKRGVKKAQEMGIIIEEATKKELMKEYYQIYLATMERLEASVRPYEFFETLLDTLTVNGHLNVLLAKDQDTFIAGLISISWRKKLHIFGNVSLPESQKLRPNDLLYYTVINWAIETGHQFVDFGLAPLEQGSGLYQFKKRWGGTPKLLYLSSRNYRKFSGPFSSLLDKIRR